MSELLHPLKASEIESWAKRHGATVTEARRRFVQYVALECIARSPSLHDRLAFKGGNALRFVYGNPRSTIDLDFTAVLGLPDEEDVLRSMLNAALLKEGKAFGIKVKCQRVNRKPRKKQATLPTYDISLGFQFPDDRYYADFDEPKRIVATIIEIEISFNDLVCETIDQQLSPGSLARLKVCTLEDILAEKLRAMLQQVTRNRNRPQDVFDIAQMVRKHRATLRLELIASYLLEKSKARGISASRAAFHNDEVRTRAAEGYEALLAATQLQHLPFAEAWSEVMDFIAQLAIPEK